MSYPPVIYSVFCVPPPDWMWSSGGYDALLMVDMYQSEIVTIAVVVTGIHVDCGIDQAGDQIVATS